VRKRTVVTTGASSGIGLATALELAAAGHRSIATIRSQAKAEIVERAARDRGVEVETHRLDVRNAGEAKTAMEVLQPDVLVNNAGFALFGAVESVPEEDVQALFETVLFGPVRLARLALPVMRERGWGRVIYMSSLFGRVSAPPLGWYASAKHALEGIADAMRMEVARDGIDVVVIEPGGVRSPMLEAAQRRAEGYESSVYDESLRRASDGLRLTDFLRADPRGVARVVVRAVETKRPQARYLVGYDAQLIGRMSPVLPTWLSDRVTRFIQGL